MMCSTARANRAYCHGHHHGDHELNLAQTAAYFGHRRRVFECFLHFDLFYYFLGNVFRCEDHVSCLLLGHYKNNDETSSHVGGYMDEQGRYAAVHPTIRYSI